MDIKQIRTLIAIAETGSATRAGELLHLVQPAVSRHIRLLEEECGVPLFERERHGMVLTDAGRTLVEYGRRALRELDKARAEIGPATTSVSGRLTIGLLASTSRLLAGELVARVRARYPAVTVSITVGYAGNVLQWLEAGDIELALLYDTRSSNGLQAEALVDERLYVLGPPGEFTGNEPFPLKGLKDRPMVMPNASHGLRSIIEHALAVAGISVDVVAETNALDLQKSLVAKGFGYTILPTSAVLEELQAGTLSGAPVGTPDLSRRIVLARAAARRPSPASAAAAPILTALMKEMVDQQAWPGAAWIGR
ncbi:LysR family nitrogen assimilation transcriptional regulator [Massilia sp. UYP32]|uniref:Bacterial regulatory helix-turn-helix, lysR family protein n=1 Tax=Massilia timonae TaxID=47229 RepID=A0A1S2NCH9_9BURK|nr:MULTISPECIES: LysR family transcriptional regulator [Massilia]OIJ42791.1 bacterial regulatory helix-turn-helix, lysR family protein [Massilia timonae]QYG02245.1 LysR family transcriptional regulator [Massilia sp. NP310]